MAKGAPSSSSKDGWGFVARAVGDSPGARPNMHFAQVGLACWNAVQALELGLLMQSEAAVLICNELQTP